MDRIKVPGTAYLCTKCDVQGYTTAHFNPTCECGGQRKSEVLLPNPRARIHKDTLPQSDRQCAIVRMRLDSIIQSR